MTDIEGLRQAFVTGFLSGHNGDRFASRSSLMTEAKYQACRAFPPESQSLPASVRDEPKMRELFTELREYAYAIRQDWSDFDGRSLMHFVDDWADRAEQALSISTPVPREDS